MTESINVMLGNFKITDRNGRMRILIEDIQHTVQNSCGKFGVEDFALALAVACFINISLSYVGDFI